MDKLLGNDSFGSVSLATVLGLGATFVWLTAFIFASAAFEPWMRWIAGDDSDVVWVAAILVTSPIGLLLFSALERMQLDRSFNADFLTALGAALINYWPQILFVCAVSAILAGWCYRRHRRYSEHGAVAWACFVLVTGVPGLIGYLLHRRWLVMERCRQCGKESPRDRNACLACGAEFPTPALKGTEIFA